MMTFLTAITAAYAAGIILCLVGGAYTYRRFRANYFVLAYALIATALFWPLGYVAALCLALWQVVRVAFPMAIDGYKQIMDAILRTMLK